MSKHYETARRIISLTREGDQDTALIWRIEAVLAKAYGETKPAPEARAIPEGWKAMPPELTEGMMLADRAAADKYIRGDVPEEIKMHEYGQAIVCYRAVFAAAPQEASQLAQRNEP